MDKTFIYSPPKSFDAIVKTLKPFIDPFVYDKLIVCDNNAIFPSSSVDFTDRRSVTSMEDLGFSMPRSGSENPSKTV